MVFSNMSAKVRSSGVMIAIYEWTLGTSSIVFLAELAALVPPKSV